MTRNCSARITPARWFRRPALGCLCLLVSMAAPATAAMAKRRPAVKPPPKAAPQAHDLAGLVRAWRAAPTPARRAAVEAWAAAHPKDATPAQLALGIGAYEQKDLAGAIAKLRMLPSKLPSIADYVGYYLAAARVEAGDFANAARDVAAARTGEVIPPLAARSWLIEARALKMSQPAEAVRVLLDNYAALPQPEGDVTL